MQTYDEMSTTKGHPWVPQESQDYVLRSPNVEHKNVHVQQMVYPENTAAVTEQQVQCSIQTQSCNYSRNTSLCHFFKLISISPGALKKRDSTDNK